MAQTLVDSPMLRKINTAKEKSLRVVIHCSNGYVFEEVYRPIIESIYEKCTIDLLMSDYYLGQHVRDRIESLLLENKLNSYKIIPAQERDGSFWAYHRTIYSAAKALLGEPVDILLIGADFQLFERYLLRIIAGARTLTVVLQTGTLIRILEKFRIQSGLKTYEKPYTTVSYRVQHFKSLPTFSQKLRFIYRFIDRTMLTPLRHRTGIIKNYYLFPVLLVQRFFPMSSYDKLAFCSGRSDVVVCYSDVEKEAIESVISSVQNVCLAEHPSSFYGCRCGSKPKEAKEAILVTFGGCLYSEMEEKIMEKWIRTIKRAAELTGISKIHLRFHPRMSPACLWPKKLLASLEQSGFDVRSINALEFSLSANICDYSLMIGSPSGALRVARSICRKIMIVGLPNCCDGGPDDQEWIVGDVDGISWINETEELEAKHLQKNPTTVAYHPTVAELLFRLREEKISRASETTAENLSSDVKNSLGRELLNQLVVRKNLFGRLQSYLCRPILRLTPFGFKERDGIKEELIKPSAANIFITFFFLFSRKSYQTSLSSMKKRLDLMENQVSEEQNEILRKLIFQLDGRGSNILEIGSWMGCSTLSLAKSARQRGGKVFCIDSWGERGLLTERLNYRAKNFDIFSFFRENLKEKGIWDVVYPLMGDSDTALDMVRDGFFDFIFIDGDHRYSQCIKDIKGAFKKLKVGGILCGHDCECRPEDLDRQFIDAHCEEDYVGGDIYKGRGVHCGVIKAVAECFEKYEIEKDIWIVRKTEETVLK